jgi:hypothetical protein
LINNVPPACVEQQTVLSLYIASVIADCFSSLTLLYLGDNLVSFQYYKFQTETET